MCSSGAPDEGAARKSTSSSAQVVRPNEWRRGLPGNAHLVETSPPSACWFLSAVLIVFPGAHRGNKSSLAPLYGRLRPRWSLWSPGRVTQLSAGCACNGTASCWAFSTTFAERSGAFIGKSWTARIFRYYFDILFTKWLVFWRTTMDACPRNSYVVLSERLISTLLYFDLINRRPFFLISYK